MVVSSRPRRSGRSDAGYNDGKTEATTGGHSQTRAVVTMEPTIRTPPLVTPTMSRAGPEDDGDGASSDVVSLTRALLSPRDKAEVVREIV